MSGVRFGWIRGSPYTAHVKLEGQWTAFCGKKPGEGQTRMGRRRAGWRIAIYTTSPHLICEKCLAKATEMGVKIVNGEIRDAGD